MIWANYRTLIFFICATGLVACSNATLTLSKPPLITLSSESFVTFTEYKLAVEESSSAKKLELDFLIGTHGSNQCDGGSIEPIQNNEHNFSFQKAGRWSLCVIESGSTRMVWSQQLNVTGNSIPVASDVQLVVKQNGSITVKPEVSDTDLDAVSIVIKKQPAKGNVSIIGGEITYSTKDALYAGSDSFTYAASDGVVESEVATISIIIEPLVSGSSEFVEDYSGGAFTLDGWKSATSVIPQLEGSLRDFNLVSYGSDTLNARRISVIGDPAQYSGDAFYTDLFSALPTDGFGAIMRDYYWSSDVIKIPECIYDVEMEAKLVAPTSGSHNLILINYRIEDDPVSGGQKFTGYQLLWNSGGSKSLTLSRFIEANEKALAFTDRWPGTPGESGGGAPNPVNHGPYKGWDYYNGSWAAGGNLLHGTAAGREVLLAIRYRYNQNSGATTIGWEARPIDGTDNSPESYDKQRTLTGIDSLAPGGGFGFMPITYHSGSTIISPNLNIVGMTLRCHVP
jgi:hypothetical protein